VGAAVDTIFLHGLKCDCVIGVWAWEKKIPQTIILDVDMATDICTASQTDDLNDALDYNRIAERIVKASQFELIETLVAKLADTIMEEFAVNWIRIRLDKGQAVSQVKHVGIEIERGERG
jgi:dihydroneopterin aldolase